MDREFNQDEYFTELFEMGCAARREILQRDLGLEELYRDWEQIYRAKLEDRTRRQEIRAQQPSKPTTDYLSADDFKKLHAAVSAANFSGSCLNAFLTINWHLLGPEVDGYESFKELRSRIRWWLRDRQVPWFGVYVWENPGGIFNSHLLFHLPPELKGPDRRMKGFLRDKRNFFPWLYRSFSELTGQGELPDSALDLQCRARDAFDPQWEWMKYMLKGLDPAVQVRDEGKRIVPLWELGGLRLKPQGRIVGTRAGVTETLSMGRLKKTGYRSPLQRGVYSADELYSDLEYRFGRGMKQFRYNQKHPPGEIVSAIIGLQDV